MSRSPIDLNATAHTGLKPFAWRGITGLVPPDWDISAVSGTPSAGYIGLDDDLARRLEVKWAKARKRGQMGPGEMLTQYIKAMRKNLEKGQTLEVERNANVIGFDSLPDDREAISYQWEHEDGQGLGLVWYCSTCGQVLIAQIQGSRSGFNLRTASNVLTSLKCHPTSAAQFWAVFDFGFACPLSFVLQRHKLQSGLLSFEFAHGSDRLYVERLGMAETILEHTDPTLWVPKVHWKKLRRRRMRFLETDTGSHLGWAIEGEKWRLLYLLPSPVSDWIRRVLKKDWIAGYMWVCPEANRLFIVRAEGPHSTEVASAVAESIECHTEQDGG